MVYTASIISYALKNLKKPVIITSLKIPLFECQSYGKQNLLNSLFITTHYLISEVTVLFTKK
ncbi:MAG: asparaginase domain-containing protein [Buchnera aphidicola (Nurudea yanoniella)]